MCDILHFSFFAKFACWGETLNPPPFLDILIFVLEALIHTITLYIYTIIIIYIYIYIYKGGGGGSI